MNHEIISRYIHQPARLPRELRARIELAWEAEPIRLYALADLDQRLVLGETWVALGDRHLSVARPAPSGAWEIQTIDRGRIRGLQLSPGLSANTLLLLGEPNEDPLAVVRYTQRQRGAFENIRFVLDEAVAGRVVTPSAEDADRVYADAVARPVRDAQALVAGRESAVIFRLLGYLAPYRRQVAIGLGAAAIVTLASLVPPYLAGFLLDQVVRPAQAGVIALHHLHIWPLGAGEIALTAHLVRPNDDDHDAFIDATLHALDERFGINHATLQIERGQACGHDLHDAAPHHSH
jgi:hypothetical protein